MLVAIWLMPKATLYFCLPSIMSWFEQMIRRYEHRRWADEPNRRMLPFAWGLEHIGGRADDPHPARFLERFVEETLARSDEWYATEPADDYVLDNGVLSFTSAIASPWPENNRVYGQFFPRGAPILRDRQSSCSLNGMHAGKSSRPCAAG